MQGSKHARELRKSLTDAEQRLWYYLRNRRLNGYKFRRQVAVGPYIADFVCMSARTVVEIDGGQHAQRQEYDQRRSQYLQHKGFLVLRFWNNEVLQNTQGVLTALLEVLSERSQTLTLPSP